MQTCPQPEHLKQFLEERLGETDAAALTQHLETCAACRKALDHLSADGDSQNWRRLRNQGPQPADEPPAEFMRRLGGVLVPGSTLVRTALPGARPPHTSTPRLERHPTPAGYEILEKRGRGGIGIVYKARDLRLKRTVAIKMLLTGVEASTEERARLRAEAEAVACLQHPNIVQIHEIGEQDGCPFLVLEYVEGQSLAERLGGTPQPPQTAARLVEAIARAMHYAHEHGVVHRDLKPANILLAGSRVAGSRGGDTTEPTAQPHHPTTPPPEPTPKITDFGLAKRLDEQSQTQTGQVLGTPSYMAPEQARGHSKAIGPAADIYALGAILYQLLTGRPPFQGVTSLETIMQVLHEEPVPPRRLQPSLPRDVETVCLKCLAKEPGKRYASALELAEDLQRFQTGEPIRARRVGLLGQGRRWIRRNPVAAGLIAALLLVLVGGYAAVTWSYLGAEAAREREALAHQQEAEQRDLSELHLYYSRIALAEREWHANNVARAEHLLDQCLPPEGRPDRRGWEWYYLKRLCHADLLTVQAHRFPLSGLAFSPNGKYLASAAGDRGYRSLPRTIPGELMLWDAQSYQKLGNFLGHRGSVDGVAFDRDSARIASVSTDNTARLWDISSRSEIRFFPIDINPYWRSATPAFSLDGKSLAVPSRRELRVVDLATEEASDNPSDHTDWVGVCAFSPDGKLLAVAGGMAADTARDDSKPSVIVRDAATHAERYRLPIWARAVTFSPDNQLLAIAYEDTVLVCEAATGREKFSLRGHDGPVYSAAWSQAGRFLATAGADQTVRVWEAQTGREHRVFRGHTGTVLRVAYHPGARRLVSGDETGVLKVWDVGRDQRVLELSNADKTGDMAFTTDGTGIRAVAGDTFRGWEIATGRETFSHPAGSPQLPEWPLHTRAFSSDGRFCAGPDPDDLKTLCVWNVETGEPPLKLTGHQVGVRTVTFSPDGRRLASASGVKGQMEPRELFVWQLPESGRGEASRVELPCESQVQCLAFSTDGRRLVAGERGKQVPNERPRTEWPWVDGYLSVWDTTTGQQLHRWLGHTGTVQSVAFDPKGRWVASAGRSEDHTVRLWNAETGELLHDLRGPETLTCVAFHPDGTRLAAAGYEGWVHLWDAATGLDILTLRGPGSRMYGGGVNDTRVVFSPDGTRLAVNSWTGSIHVWDARPLAGK